MTDDGAAAAISREVRKDGRKEERKGIHVFTQLLDYTITTELAVSADCWAKRWGGKEYQRGVPDT